MQTLRRTPLYDRHVALGARMVPFAGWEMPVQYEGVIPEHKAVRNDAGVFDVSHMGELEIEGPTARDLLQATLSNDVDKLEPGDAQYTLVTNDGGGIVDDVILYRLDGHRYLVVANASNAGAVFDWLKERELRGSDVRDVSDDYALLAVQGPRALERLGLDRAKPFTWAMGDLDGVEVMVNRTGYTGEEGVELACMADEAGQLWDAILARGVVPCGRLCVRATRCASRSATRCTGTTSARTGTRSRRASAGRARSARTSPAPSACARSRRTARRRSSCRS